MDLIDDFGPGRSGSGGLDPEVTEEETSEGGAGEGGAGYVSPVEGNTDPSAQPSYRDEVEAERTGTTAGDETAGPGDAAGGWASGGGVGADLARDEDPTERS